MTLARLTAKHNDMIAELPVCCVFKHGFKSFPLEIDTIRLYLGRWYGTTKWKTTKTEEEDLKAKDGIWLLVPLSQTLCSMLFQGGDCACN